MILCHCNEITLQDIEATIIELLEEDRWQLIVPAKVYHRMGKRGRCCGCFPGMIDVIVRTSEAYHRQCESADNDVVMFIARLKEFHTQNARSFHERPKAGHRAA